jgi:hypothetical protein
MTRPSFPTPQHDGDASAIRVDEPSAGGRVAGPMVGCPVDRGAIDGRSLLGAPDPAAVADPYPRYARLRAEDPVHRTPDGLWVLTRHADVAAVLRAPRFGREGFERHFGTSGPSTPDGDGLASAACPATGGHRQATLSPTECQGGKTASCWERIMWAAPESK